MHVEPLQVPPEAEGQFREGDSMAGLFGDIEEAGLDVGRLLSATGSLPDFGAAAGLPVVEAEDPFVPVSTKPATEKLELSTNTTGAFTYLSRAESPAFSLTWPLDPCVYAFDEDVHCQLEGLSFVPLDEQPSMPSAPLKTRVRTSDFEAHLSTGTSAASCSAQSSHSPQPSHSSQSVYPTLPASASPADKPSWSGLMCTTLLLSPSQMPFPIKTAPDGVQAQAQDQGLGDTSSGVKRGKAKKPGSKKAGASASKTSTGKAKKKRSSSVMQDVAVHGLPKVTEALVYMLRAVATRMELSATGRRDWAGLCEALKNDPEVPEMFTGKLTPAFKNMVKNWLQERRKIAQLRVYCKLSVVDMRLALRIKMSGNFGDEFVNVLGGYLASLRAEDKAAPGFVLEWPNHVRAVVVGQMMRLHRTRYGLRLHRLHKDFFFELFSPAEVELAVLATCDCGDCAKAWPFSYRCTYMLQGGGQAQGEGDAPQEDSKLTSRLDVLRYEWTRQKAGLMAAIVTAHDYLGSQMYAHLAETQPKLKNWSDADMDYLLHQVHPAKHCDLCKSKQGFGAKKQKRGESITDTYPLPYELSFYDQPSFLLPTIPPTVDDEVDVANQLANLAL